MPKQIPPLPSTASPAVLSFNTTDPVGAIGIQADLGSFAAMRCHGLSVITSLLISDTTQVEDVQAIESDWVADQARVVLEDMSVAAIKIGIVGSVDNVSAIAEVVSDYPDLPLVLDPFCSALPEQGPDYDDILAATRDLLIPQATVLLLSAVELARLAETWREPGSDDTLETDVAHLIESGCEYVLVTNTAADAHQIINTLFNHDGVVRQDTWGRISGSYSGAGATLSAAITGLLANGSAVPEAVYEAQEFTLASIAHAQQLGMGRRVLDRYFWADDPAAEETASDAPSAIEASLDPVSGPLTSPDALH